MAEVFNQTKLVELNQTDPKMLVFGYFGSKFR